METARLLKLHSSLSALQQAQAIGQQTSAVGFDWTAWQGAAAKVVEEWQELQLELVSQEPHLERHKKCQHELGDLLFSIAQLARHLGIDPEQALLECNARFVGHFEKAFELSGLSESQFLALPAAEKEIWYQRAKSVHQ